jgi:hypothetical protein
LSDITRNERLRDLQQQALQLANRLAEKKLPVGAARGTQSSAVAWLLAGRSARVELRGSLDGVH